MPNKYAKQLQGLKVDKRFYDMLYAEVGGGPPDEVAAAASVFINELGKSGYEKALKRSSAYLKQSPEYRKAAGGKLNAYEQVFYDRNKEIVDNLIDNPDLVLPYTHFENINAFGEPSWAGKMRGFKNIGRQRFYIGD